MPMFSGGSGYQINGGTFYEVSGDVNLETHQHLTLANYPRLRGALQDPQENLLNGTSDRLGVERNPSTRSGHRVVSRAMPYDMSSDPCLSDVENSSPARRAPSSSIVSMPSMQDSSSIPRLPHWQSHQHPAAEYSPLPDVTHNVDGLPQVIHGPATVLNANNVHFNNQYGDVGLELLYRSVSQAALYNSAETFPQPKCHPETRIEMLNYLYEWATSSDVAYPICWLHGPAGAGKSAIMQTLCHHLQEARGGSFFFKRGHATSGNANWLFATLAYQLAVHKQNSVFRCAILRRLQDDPSVTARTMEIQLEELIVKPSRSLRNAPPLILLIDGLDECIGEEAQRQILHLIGDTACRHPFTFRFLIASRPEAHIKDVFNDLSFRGIFRSININKSFHDVRKYLCGEFARIHREHKDTMAKVSAPWPPEHIIDVLVEKSSGHFIYASTVIKFIDDKYFRPTQRLAVIQSLVPSFDSPFGALDQLYCQILSRIPSQFHDKLCQILCLVADFGIKHIGHIEQLLQLDSGDVLLTLRGLHSLIEIHSYYNYNDLSFHHASFPDFLRDASRSSNFFLSLRVRMHILCASFVTLSIPKACHDQGNIAADSGCVA
ncbi:hypothetical protein GGX14DRAFT_57090 [Mycena pura]|uniref:Nephrocystin 3-like N-terminal domain-containing protein n=1 Tax=Mycena pura TaxID=153505 RepID=A0AAD6Y166_9AGAR|nr:hypothetical protein GGX14DRAFT_57090 [Mycena pura]